MILGRIEIAKREVFFLEVAVGHGCCLPSSEENLVLLLLVWFFFLLLLEPLISRLGGVRGGDITPANVSRIAARRTEHKGRRRKREERGEIKREVKDERREM